MNPQETESITSAPSAAQLCPVTPKLIDPQSIKRCGMDASSLFAACGSETVRYIARINSEDGAGKKQIKWVHLERAETIAQAQAELRSPFGQLEFKPQFLGERRLKQSSPAVSERLCYFLAPLRALPSLDEQRLERTNGLGT
jgi:hypothetical protein